MPYRFKGGEDSVQDSVRRISVEQIARAINEIDDSDIDVDETIHQVRKRCKKVRGLIRLVRPAFSAYRDENSAFRDAAKALSYLRDATTIIGTYDSVVEHFDNQIERKAFASIRRRLTLQHHALHDETDVEGTLSDFRELMIEAHDRAATWKVEEDGYKAIAGGLGKTYKRARKAMAAAFQRLTTRYMHEWRKCVKYHWYHARLLQTMLPTMINPHVEAADRLSELLGDHHDLAVLRGRLQSDPEQFGSKVDIDAFAGLIGQRQQTLAVDSFALGRVLLAEKRKSLTDRWHAYWDVWQKKDLDEQGVLVVAAS